MSGEILLVGAFHEMIELCEDAGFSIVGIIDNALTGEYYGYPVIGKDADASALMEKYPGVDVVLSPDSPYARKKLQEYYSSLGFSFATVVHPEASISRFASIGEGTVVQRGVNISANSRVGRFCKLNSFCNVMHDNVVGDFATIAPNAVLLGYVSVGTLCYIGANSTILPKCAVGNESIVGAGAVVTKCIEPNKVVAGIPARQLENSRN